MFVGYGVLKCMLVYIFGSLVIFWVFIFDWLGWLDGKYVVVMLIVYFYLVRFVGLMIEVVLIVIVVVVYV